ncbi:hypothetical protein PL8927_820012 [Planktothrix serta PCC 8927]|uniref:Uncharacterized protein n=1 Tax=Planktothrix serta PCC 8927 TaxID=671068 RepID=A0A7Z9BZR5_9CYAN|nr:hypothetical protein [Planktothrix serta]VXD24390.1 hypothetical protein PL8927_820012 [Planktothrix serta PCC 8927]
MFSNYSLPWLKASYTLPVVYSRLVWWSMMYPSICASELWKAYWKSNLSPTASPSPLPEEPIVVTILEEIAEAVVEVEPVEILPLAKAEIPLTLEPPPIVEEKPLTILTVEAVQTPSISIETLPQSLPLPSRQKPENRKRVIRLLQSFAITQLEDINRLTLDRTKSLAKALGISQSIQGEKKKVAVLKDEVKQRLLDAALLEA